MTRMRRIRQSLGWTQAQMGRYLGVAGPSVSRIENGQRARPIVEKALDRLEIDIAEGRVAPAPAAAPTEGEPQ